MRKGHGEKKTVNEEKAIIALLTEPTLKQAATKAGIGESTLWRWMQEPEFSERYRQAKKQAVSNAISQLQQACGEAVSTLREIMADTDAPAPSRVTSAKSIIELALKGIEIEDLQARIEQLEEQLQNNNGYKGIG